MGIVDYAATTCLAASGVALSAPFLAAKVPALAPMADMATNYRKPIGIFGIVGGALGLLLIPIVLLLVVGFGAIFENILVILIALLELVGCAGTIALGVMVLRMQPSEEPHSGELDVKTMAGLGGIAFGVFLFLVITVGSFLS